MVIQLPAELRSQNAASVIFTIKDLAILCHRILVIFSPYETPNISLKQRNITGVTDRLTYMIATDRLVLK